MERIPEPELMDDAAQARAYSEADFAEPHEHFVDRCGQAFPPEFAGDVIDLGCGPADVTVRFARRYPGTRIVGIDAAEAMLALGRERIRRNGLEDRIELRRARLPTTGLETGFTGAISNSLLHHLPDPLVLWRALRQLVRTGSPVFVMDLARPATPGAARDLVDLHAAGEPEVLRRDFLHSLHAAWTPGEVRSQLESCGLGSLAVSTVSDRHLVVSGRLPQAAPNQTAAPSRPRPPGQPIRSRRDD